VIHTGHLSIEGLKLSKSKGAEEVRSGKYIGWDDPRTWSLQSLKNRGIKPEAIREFILSMGITKANSTIAIDVLYTINRRLIEKSPRYFFVPSPVKITIKGCPKLNAKLPLHPTEKIGFREYKTTENFLIPQQDFDLMQNGNYRLLYLLNFRAENIGELKPREFRFISKEPDEKLNVKFIQWLPADDKNINVKVRMPDNSIVEGLGEPELSKLKPGAIVQFERFGFVRLHKKKKNEMEFWFAHP